MTSKESANRYKCESFNHFRTRSVDSERGFTIVIGYINLMTMISVNVNV